MPQTFSCYIVSCVHNDFGVLCTVAELDWGYFIKLLIIVYNWLIY